jgi:CubicO group peptidase (beta-lactamase class C family)
VKRIVLGIVLVIAVVTTVALAREPLFWKRYLLAAIYSPATLPGAFYEPTELIEGGDGAEPPRVDPELEQLDPAALRAAADYAGARKTTALIVARHGHIVFEQYWDDQRFDAVADLGSFDATLAALMVGIAMGDRKIGLIAEPLENYVEELRNDPRGAITLADLLQSSSGLTPAASGFGPWSQAARERFGTDTTARCLSREATAPPGKRWLPQVCDVQLLALVLERATGGRYARYISEHLWKPIGAADAQLAREDENGAPRAACCLRARRGDWIRIAELLVSDGRFEGEQIVPPGWVRQMLAPSRANQNFGFQVWIGQPFAAELAVAEATEPYAVDDLYLLKGAGKARLWFVPSLALSILRTGTNSESDKDWDDARVPNLIIRGTRDFVPKAVAPGSQDIRSLVPNH